MENQIKIYRHEVKYYLNKREAFELSLVLKEFMKLDTNSNDVGSYWIRSLYFDTLDNRDYYEKVIGYNIRKKVRLRIYDINTDTVKLEIKNKNNHYTLKETISITREDANKLIRGDSSPLLKYKEHTTNKVFAFMHQNLYRPAVVVDYEREAYLYPFQNIRVTLDRNVRSSSGTDKLFTEDTCMIPVFNKDILVLEIKYDYMIPIFLQKIISNFSTQGSQISKYCLGRNTIRM